MGVCFRKQNEKGVLNKSKDFLRGSWVYSKNWGVGKGK